MANINQNKSIIALTRNGIIFQSETVSLDKTVKNQLYIVYNKFTLLFFTYLFILRECKCMGEEQREKETESQAGSTLSVQSAKQGSILQTVRS